MGLAVTFVIYAPIGRSRGGPLSDQNLGTGNLGANDVSEVMEIIGIKKKTFKLFIIHKFGTMEVSAIALFSWFFVSIKILFSQDKYYEISLFDWRQLYRDSTSFEYSNLKVYTENGLMITNDIGKYLRSGDVLKMWWSSL